jgi:hypothetical protein
MQPPDLPALVLAGVNHLEPTQYMLALSKVREPLLSAAVHVDSSILRVPAQSWLGHFHSMWCPQTGLNLNLRHGLPVSFQ